MDFNTPQPTDQLCAEGLFSLDTFTSEDIDSFLNDSFFTNQQSTTFATGYSMCEREEGRLPAVPQQTEAILGTDNDSLDDSTEASEIAATIATLKEVFFNQLGEADQLETATLVSDYATEGFATNDYNQPAAKPPAPAHHNDHVSAAGISSEVAASQGVQQQPPFVNSKYYRQSAYLAPPTAAQLNVSRSTKSQFSNGPYAKAKNYVTDLMKPREQTITPTRAVTGLTPTTVPRSTINSVDPNASHHSQKFPLNPPASQPTNAFLVPLVRAVTSRNISNSANYFYSEKRVPTLLAEMSQPAAEKNPNQHPKHGLAGQPVPDPLPQVEDLVDPNFTLAFPSLPNGRRQPYAPQTPGAGGFLVGKTPLTKQGSPADTTSPSQYNFVDRLTRFDSQMTAMTVSRSNSSPSMDDHDHKPIAPLPRRGNTGTVHTTNRPIFPNGPSGLEFRANFPDLDGGLNLPNTSVLTSAHTNVSQTSLVPTTKAGPLRRRRSKNDLIPFRYKDGQSLYRCQWHPDCLECFANGNPAQWRSHILEHLNALGFLKDGKVKCHWPRCTNTSGMGKAQLGKHIVTCHLPDMHKCETCHTTFNRKDEFKKHREGCPQDTRRLKKQRMNPN